MIAVRVTSVSLRSVCFSSSSVSAEQTGDLLLAQCFGEGHVGAVGGDFIVFDALHAGDDDEIKDRSLFVVLLDLVLASSTRPRIASQTLRPGRKRSPRPQIQPR